MEEQFEQFQRGVNSAFEAATKATGPALRTNEVVLNSFSQLVKDQFEFSQSCINIGQRQLDSFKDADVSALFNDQGASSDYYAAAKQYGEALRANTQNTQEQLTAIGNELKDTFAGFAQEGAQAPSAKKASDKASDKTAKSA